MPDQVMLDDALGAHDWSRYSGSGSAVRHRGELRRRRRRRGALLGAAVAAALGAAIPTLGPRMLRPERGSVAPAHTPGEPVLPKSPSSVLAAGVVGEGDVQGLFWQVAWETVVNRSGDKAQPALTCRVVTAGTVTRRAGCQAQAGAEAGFGVATIDARPDLPPALVFVVGTAPGGTASLTAYWDDGRSRAVPIAAHGLAGFAFAPDDQPSSLVERGAYGTRTLTVARSDERYWQADYTGETAVEPAAPPPVPPLTGVPHLASSPAGEVRESGLEGVGVVDDLPWELAYRVLPQPTAADPEAVLTCEDVTLDGQTTNRDCAHGALVTASAPQRPAFDFRLAPGEDPPLLVQDVQADARTTAMGLEWSDGTRSASAVVHVSGGDIAALAFAPSRPPAFALMMGSYGEKKVPLVAHVVPGWVID